MSLINKKSNITLGVSFSIAEVICTISIASLVKLIAGDLSVFMVLFFRYLFYIGTLIIIFSCLMIIKRESQKMS